MKRWFNEATMLFKKNAGQLLLLFCGWGAVLVVLFLVFVLILAPGFTVVVINSPVLIGVMMVIVLPAFVLVVGPLEACMYIVCFNLIRQQPVTCSDVFIGFKRMAIIWQVSNADLVGERSL